MIIPYILKSGVTYWFVLGSDGDLVKSENETQVARLITLQHMLLLKRYHFTYIISGIVRVISGGGRED